MICKRGGNLLPLFCIFRKNDSRYQFLSQAFEFGLLSLGF